MRDIAAEWLKDPEFRAEYEAWRMSSPSPRR